MMEAESRRSTAAQFFIEEDEEAKASMSTYDQVVELLNEASLLQKDNRRVNNLKQVQELILNKEPNLLDNFLDEMLAFQNDRSADVKKCIIGFMEAACNKDLDILYKVLPNLSLMLADSNINVQKRVILCLSHIHRATLLWISKARTVTEEMEQIWTLLNKVIRTVIEMLESENDGVRTHVAKLMEGLCITLSRKTAESEIPKKQSVAISIDQLPENHQLFKIKKLEDEGNKIFDGMIQFLSSAHISSVNLMTIMGGLTNIAKQRPQFFDRVVQGVEALHVNLPPTLAKSQVSSVRKNLKMQLLTLLKHPHSINHLSPITTLLTDLGATQSEVMKAMPKVEESKKRKAEDSESSSKKAKLMETEADADDDDAGGMTPWPSNEEKQQQTTSIRQTAIDITATDLLAKLTPQNVADLVLISMVMLPDAMPAHFQSTYTPIAAAGTDAQTEHMARLLATQLTVAGLGKGVVEMKLETAAEDDGGTSPLDDGGTSPKQLIQTLVGGSTAGQNYGDILKKPELLAAISQPSRKGIKPFKLSYVTHPLDRDRLDMVAIKSFERILDVEKSAEAGCALNARNKILVSLVSQFGGQLKDLLQDYIFQDLRNRGELAFSWLYQEYANCQGYSRFSLTGEKNTLASYDECLTRLLNGLMERPDYKEGMFNRMILESPVITDNAIQVLRKYCQDENRIYLGMSTLRDLIMMRPSHRLRFLDVLLDFTCHEKPEVRTSAIRVAKKLHEQKEMTKPIEKCALVYLKYLINPKPPPEIFAGHKVRSVASETWAEDTIKHCLYLYLGLLPVNHALIHELATVYTATTPDIKRIILRVLESPVKGMGMQSPELLLLVENCPKGAETLVTRIIHILTDKAMPCQELVDRVRDLYQKRVPDVRFLIPVLTGLTKKEIIAALAKLIKLNPIVVKEVFNRLLKGHGESSGPYTSPLAPAELLVALHNIDPAKCDMKTIIKATNLCFTEKSIYTQEVLAVVMQQLMEQNPLPTLLMRTVLQSLSMYPRLVGLVLNILQRLITKQVWKQKKMWEGFIRCCQRTKPQSFQVLLQLPAPHLNNVFDIIPDLRGPLLAHINSFTPHQKAHLPKAIILVLEKNPAEDQKIAEAKVLAERERIALEEQVTLSVNQEEQDLVMKENQALMMSAAEMDRERREGPSMEINRIEDIPIVGRAEMDNQEFQTSSVSNEAYMDTQAQLLAEPMETLAGPPVSEYPQQEEVAGPPVSEYPQQEEVMMMAPPDKEHVQQEQVTVDTVTKQIEETASDLPDSEEVTDQSQVTNDATEEGEIEEDEKDKIEETRTSPRKGKSRRGRGRPPSTPGKRKSSRSKK